MSVDEPTRESIAAEFPAWEPYESFSQPWARLRGDPGVRVRGEDWMDLRDEIKRTAARMEEGL
ncbi:MAG: hypothetical protein ACRDND_31720 [Streptosporangiaceae bacterium]